MTRFGIDADGVAEKEADHFMKCPACSQWFDMGDLAPSLVCSWKVSGMQKRNG
jgi:hypothetical protein